MKKILVFLSLLALSGCSFLGGSSERDISEKEANNIFAEAFLRSFDTEEKLEMNGEIGVEIEVSDNENNVLPSVLEAARMDLDFSYDVSHELVGEVAFSASLNESSAPDFGVQAKLENKKLSYTLTDISQNIVLFFGIEEMFGGDTEMALRAISVYKDREEVIELSDEQYDEIESAIKGTFDESVQNTKEQEQAIHQAFIQSGVFSFSGGRFEEGIYSLNFDYSAHGLTNFLNKVAEINGEEMDFSAQQDVYKKVQINGVMKINEAKEITSVKGDIFVDRGLIKEAEKDLVLEYEYRQGSFSLKMIDALENTVQARLKVEWVVE